MTEKSGLPKDTVVYKALELSLKQKIQFFFSYWGRGIQFAYENQVSLDSKEFSFYQLIPH